MRNVVMPDKLLDNTNPPLHSVYEIFKYDYYYYNATIMITTILLFNP